ncbi:MAG: hypothetical protein ACE5EX_12255 [Phycisphaerae bacterium]
MRLKDAKRIWSSLGRWEVPVDDRDLARQVLEAAARECESEPTTASHRPVRSLLQIAASILVSAGIGFGAAQWRLAGGADAATSEADHAAATEALHLRDFQNGSPGCFAETILGFRTPQSGREERP